MNNLPDGPGVAGSFLGLADDFTNPVTAKIAILPVPFEKTTSFQKGTAAGPEVLLEASRNIEGYDVETGLEIFRVGIETVAPIIADSSEEMLSQLYKESSRLMDQGKFVVTIGGEHSISQAPIKAAAERHENLSILQFDAHTDLRDAYEGNPLSHASVMARVNEIENVENIVAVGIRAMDVSESLVAKRDDLFFDHELQAGTEWIEKVIARLEPKVYISFDIDVFSSEIMPATGTPEPGGINWHQALSLLREVCSQREVVGFDLVELMPLPGLSAPNFLAAKLIYKFLNYRFCNEL